MTPEEEIYRGNEARSVINNPIYKEALILLKAQMMETFQRTKYDQKEEREEIWREMKVLDALERQLESVMRTGRLAELTPQN